jgi:hypothetical protein
MRLLDRLNTKLAESFSKAWGTRETLHPEIVALVEDSRTGAISGVLRFNILTRSGEEAVAFEHPFNMLQTEQDVDDLLADSLSRLLAVHSSWPR